MTVVLLGVVVSIYNGICSICQPELVVDFAERLPIIPGYEHIAVRSFQAVLGQSQDHIAALPCPVHNQGGVVIIQMKLGKQELGTITKQICSELYNFIF